MLALGLLVMCSSPLAHAATFLVDPRTGQDSNPGDEARPFKTISRGLQGSGGSLRPGDTLLLRDGIYDELVRKIPSGSSETQRVTIKAVNRHKAIVRPTVTCTADGNGAIINFRGGEAWVTIDGLVLDGAGAGCGSLLNFRPPGGGDLGLDWHHISIINNELKNARGTRGGAGTISGGHLNTMRARNIRISNNHIHSMGGGTDPLRYTYNHCIYFKSDDSVIENNFIHDCYGAGIASHQSALNSPQTQNHIIRNNVFSRVGNCILLSGSGMTAYNNICIDSGGPYVADVGSGDDAPLKIHLGGGSNNKLFNNVVYKSRSKLACIDIGPKATNAEVYNNICWGGLKDVILNRAVSALVSHNLCAGGGGCSITGNPQFIDADAQNFRLRSHSPAIDTGKRPTSELLTDLEGRTRPLDGPDSDEIKQFDIGAYEFSAAPPPNSLPAPPTRFEVK